MTTCDRCDAEIDSEENFSRTEEYIVCERCVKELAERSRLSEETRDLSDRQHEK